MSSVALQVASIFGILLTFSDFISPVKAAGLLVAYSTELDNENLNYEDDNLTTFREIWKFVFLWAFISIFLVHVLATVIAFASLRKHKYGRFTGACVLLYGTISSLIVTSITSAVVACLLINSSFTLKHIHVMFCGLSQCALYLIFSFTTLMATL